jgi:proteasome lid subunit RPN8/RPN11
MIELNKQHADEIREHGERDYPHECCGLLIGRFEVDGRKTVVEVYPISNAREEEAKRNRFLIEPEELLRGERYARERRLDVVGFYHSHPDHPAAPSQFDLEHAWPVYSYIIVSVREGRARDLRSWEMEADRSRFNEEEISVTGQCEIESGVGR